MSAEVMSGGGGSPKLQTKTVSPSISSQNVAPDSGYDGLSRVTVNAMPTGSLNGISVNSNGLITSSVGTSGYLSSGTNKTLQLSTQSGITIVPGTDTKIAVSNGKYTTGTIQVQGDSNLECLFLELPELGKIFIIASFELEIHFLKIRRQYIGIMYLYHLIFRCNLFQLNQMDITFLLMEEFMLFQTDIML